MVSDGKERLFSIVLAEELGEDRVSHLVGRASDAHPDVRAAAARRVEEALDTRPRSGPRPQLLAAAVLLLGLGVVFAAPWLHSQLSVGGPTGSARDPMPRLDPMPPQDPSEPEQVVPKDLAHYLELLQLATSVRLTKSVPFAITKVQDRFGPYERLDSEPLPVAVSIEGDALDEWKRAVRASSASTAPHDAIRTTLTARFALPEGRELSSYLNVGEPHRWDAGFDEPIVPNPALAELMVAAAETIDRRNRLHHGRVESAEEIAQLPAGAERLECVPELLSAGLERLPKLRHVRLRSGGAPVSDAVLERLAETSIETLDLHADSLTDEQLAAVAAIPGLRHLVLRQPGLGFTGRGLAAFGDRTRPRQLRSLEIWGGAGLTAAGVDALASLPGVERLRLVDAPLGADRSLFAALPRFASLRELEIRGEAMTDDDLESLPQTKLRRLLLVASQVTVEGLKRLGRLPSLSELEVVHAPIDGGDLADLAELTSLDRLLLVSPEITAQGLAGLRQALPDCAIECTPGQRWLDDARAFSLRDRR